MWKPRRLQTETTQQHWWTLEDKTLTILDGGCGLPVAVLCHGGEGDANNQVDNVGMNINIGRLIAAWRAMTNITIVQSSDQISIFRQSLDTRFAKISQSQGPSPGWLKAIIGALTFKTQ